MKTQKDKLDQHLYWIFTVGYVSEHRKNVLIKGLCDLFSWVYKKTSASSSDQTLYHKADQKDILFTFIWMNFNLLSFKQTSSVLLTLQKDAVISVPSCITHTNYHCTPSRLFHEPWPALHISDLCHAWHNLLCSHMMPCASNRPSGHTEFALSWDWRLPGLFCLNLPLNCLQRFCLLFAAATAIFELTNFNFLIG